MRFKIKHIYIYIFIIELNPQDHVLGGSTVREIVGFLKDYENKSIFVSKKTR